MAHILGMDTSNYTTSCAIYDTDSDTVTMRSKLLPVKSGERGIRQSDAVFHHTVQLHSLLSDLRECVGDNIKIDAVCASVRPRPSEDSYMPCFLVGEGTARSIATMLEVPFYATSHQQGHIMAAVYSARKKELLSGKLLAFHVSGGTTEAILVDSENKFMKIEILGETLDLNAGQLIDRTGVMMGLDFPCGKEIEKLALDYNEKIKVKPVLRECNCHLSGFENKLTDMYRKSGDKTMVSAYALKYVEATVIGMTEKIFEKYGEMPVIYAGGVMSNSIIRRNIEAKFKAYFASPEFSCDNSAGVAIIGAYLHRK